MKLWRLYRAFPWFEHRHRLIAKLPLNASLLEIGSSNCDRIKLFKTIRPDLKAFATDIRDFSQEAGTDVVFFVSDVTKGLPSQFDGQFDCVTTMHLFEHLPVDSYDAAVTAIKRVLKPGGQLVH